MKHSLLLTIQRRKWALVLGVALCTPELSNAQSAALDSALRGMTSPDLEIRMEAYPGLIGRYGNGDSGEGVQLLLRAHPEQAERIKLALISSLEAANAVQADTESKYLHFGEGFAEAFSDHWEDLIWAVGALRDPRAVKALLGGLGTGDMSANFLADLFPHAVDALVEMSQKPPTRNSRGEGLDYRGAALATLELSLTRLALMRAYPEAVEKARRGLLAGLDNPDPGLRS